MYFNGNDGTKRTRADKTTKDGEILEGGAMSLLSGKQSKI